MTFQKGCRKCIRKPELIGSIIIDEWAIKVNKDVPRAKYMWSEVYTSDLELIMGSILREKYNNEANN